MGLIAQVQRALKPVNRMLFDDDDLVASVIWKVFVESAFSEEDGFSTETYDEYKLDVIKLTNTTQLENGSFSASMPVITKKYGGALDGDSNNKRLLLLIQPDDFPPGASKKDLVEITDLGIYNVQTIEGLFGLYVCIEVSEQ